jgi:parvulin-like peptidyl-prolyl isomerase
MRVFHLVRGLAAILLLLPLMAVAGQVIVTIDGESVTSEDLDRAIASSPFSVQFPSMDSDEQAALRGDMLKRLVASRLLYLEAKRRGLDGSAQFKAEAEHYRLGLLHRAYMASLREAIKIPPDEMKRMRQDFKGDSDGLEAAKAKYVSERYQTLKALALARLKEHFHLKVYEDRIGEGTSAKTHVAEADGVTVTFGEIHAAGERFDRAVVEDRLYNQLELRLAARAAEEKGIDMSAQVEVFRRERLPSLLLARLEKTWVPDEKAMRSYYEAHPKLSYVPEIRNIGQIVVATPKEAESLRKRIVAGESLFRLAEKYSIDPYGRKHAGDMGWIKEGTGAPAIEAALKDLPDGQVSKVVKTTHGYHLVMILGRQKSQKKAFGEMKDRVRQAMISDRLPALLKSLRKRYQVEWKLPMVSGDAGTMPTGKHS